MPPIVFGRSAATVAVTDMRRAQAFYTDGLVLGMEVVFGGEP